MVSLQTFFTSKLYSIFLKPIIYENGAEQIHTYKDNAPSENKRTRNCKQVSLLLNKRQSVYKIPVFLLVPSNRRISESAFKLFPDAIH